MSSGDILSLSKSLLDISSFSGEESSVLIFIEEYLKQNNVDFQRIPVSKGRWSIFAQKDGLGEGIILSGHSDTVRSEEHYKSYVQDGKLFGIGSSDMKVAIAVMLYNFCKVFEKKAGLIITVGEEQGGFDGIKAVVDSGVLSGFKYCLLGESSDMNIYDSQYGIAGFNIDLNGVQGHTCDIEQKGSVVNEMIFLLYELLNEFKKAFKKSIISVNIIKAGFKTNVVPENVLAKIDVRVSSEDNLAEVESFLNHFFKPYKNLFFEKRTWRSSVKSSKNNTFVKQIKKLLNQKKLLTKKSFTEMFFYEKIGISTLCIGPGSIGNAHQKNEFVLIKNIEEYNSFIRSLIR